MECCVQHFNQQWENFWKDAESVSLESEISLTVGFIKTEAVFLLWPFSLVFVITIVIFTYTVLSGYLTLQGNSLFFLILSL